MSGGWSCEEKLSLMSLSYGSDKMGLGWGGGGGGYPVFPVSHSQTYSGDTYY